MGGVRPLGYRAEDCKLVVMDSEAEIVRAIFRRYAETRLGPAFEGRDRSPKDRQQIVDERFGSPRRRKPFSRGALYLILQNRLSRGSGSPEIKRHRRGR